MLCSVQRLEFDALRPEFPAIKIEGAMETDQKYEFEKRFLDKGIFSWHFNIKYMLLKAMGLNAYSAFAFILGVLMTICTLFIYLDFLSKI